MAPIGAYIRKIGPGFERVLRLVSSGDQSDTNTYLLVGLTGHA